MPPPIALFDGKGGVTAKFMELEHRVRQMQAEGQTPMGISDWIQSQMLPLANMTKMQLQAEVNNAGQAVSNCAQALAAAENGAQEQETTLSIGESRHNECDLVMAQKEKKASDDCQGLQGIIDSMEAPASVASANLSDTNAVESALQDNFQFYQEHYQTFLDEDHTCTSSHAAAQEQAQQCEADQANLESSFCSLRSARQLICSDYDACFLEKKALFSRVVSDVTAVEAHTKTSYQQLSCLGQTVMKDMSESSMPSCNSSAIDTTSLDVFYPSEPQQESCSGAVSTSQNYSANLCEDDGGEESSGEESSAESSGNGTSTDGNSSLVEGLKAGERSQLKVNGGSQADEKTEGQKANSTRGNTSNSNSSPHR
jgi:hypothetical protein